MRPLKTLALGFLLLLSGAALPFLIVIKVLESTFFLNILSYFFMVTGLILGFMGMTQYLHPRK